MERGFSGALAVVLIGAVALRARAGVSGSAARVGAAGMGRYGAATLNAVARNKVSGAAI